MFRSDSAIELLEDIDKDIAYYDLNNQYRQKLDIRVECFDNVFFLHFPFLFKPSLFSSLSIDNLCLNILISKWGVKNLANWGVAVNKRKPFIKLRNMNKFCKLIDLFFVSF